MEDNLEFISKKVKEIKDVNNYSEKVNFLSHISHGIRTPLNSIMGFSKLLNIKEQTVEKQKEYIQSILKGSNLLLQFVENIIDLSQFEADRYSLKIEKFDLNQLIWEFTEDFYNNKVENNDTNTNLMIVWDSKIKNLEIETDSYLLNKSIHRIISLISVKYPIDDFEIGYRKINENSMQIFVRPVLEKLSINDFLNNYQMYEVKDDNSIDFLNYQVLLKSIEMLNGRLCFDYKRQEYSFYIPLKYTENI